MRRITIAIALCFTAFAGAAVESETPKAAAETPKVESETPKAAAETPKAAAETPKAAAETPKAAAETPKAAAETPKVAATTPNSPQAAKATQAAKSPAVPKAPRAPSMEQLTCRTGPNDEQVRLVVVAVKGKPMEFAYYSRFGNKVCSIHGRRGDAYTKWEDKADAAHIKLLAGGANLVYKPGYAKLKFSEVTRMPYCGMYGDLNGVVEVSRDKSECTLAGVFD